MVENGERFFMVNGLKWRKMVKNGKKMVNDFYGERGFQNVNFHHFSPFFTIATAFPRRNDKYIGDVLIVLLPMLILTTNPSLVLDKSDEFAQIL